jgi:2,3-bisphosphoglycerate-dependent phosphoglycerate mutase
MATVWLIRHGESEANAGLPTFEPANIKLTEKGHQQAKQVALYFTQQPSLIVTSPYIRTKQTAQPTIERFSSTVQIEWPVQEFTYLASEHRVNTTLEQRRPMAEVYWKRCDPFYGDGTDGESFAEMIKRVQTLREKIILLDDEFVAVFTHGLFMKAFLWVLLTNSVEVSSTIMAQVRGFMESLPIPNGGIVKLEYQNSDIWVSGLTTSHLYNEIKTSGLQGKLD